MTSQDPLAILYSDSNDNFSGTGFWVDFKKTQPTVSGEIIAGIVLGPL
jgi:hypothetical protein